MIDNITFSNSSKYAGTLPLIPGLGFNSIIIRLLSWVYIINKMLKSGKNTDNKYERKLLSPFIFIYYCVLFVCILSVLIFFTSLINSFNL